MVNVNGTAVDFIGASENIQVEVSVAIQGLRPCVKHSALGGIVLQMIAKGTNDLAVSISGYLDEAHQIQEIDVHKTRMIKHSI